MDGATLRLLESLRSASFASHPPVGALEAFTCLLHGTATPALTPAERIWIDVVARDATTEGWARAEIFRALYDGELAAEKISERRAERGLLAIEGLLALPRAERAALALSCVLGFTDGEVAHVLGTDASGARAVIETGIAMVRVAAGAPLRRRAARAGEAA